MPRPIHELTGEELDNLIENHRRHKRTSEHRYIEALEEQARRNGRGLNFRASLEAIRTAAKEKRFLSYKQLADASGAEWTQVHYPIRDHLLRLVEYAHRQGWPMLSAIVVNKPNLDIGELEPGALVGFIKAARDLGLTVTDPRAFLKEQQQRVFEWAESAACMDA